MIDFIVYCNLLFDESMSNGDAQAAINHEGIFNRRRGWWIFYGNFSPAQVSSLSRWNDKFQIYGRFGAASMQLTRVPNPAKFLIEFSLN